MSELRRLYRATFNSLDGLACGLRNEAAIRTEFILLLIAVPLAAWLAKTVPQFLLLMASIIVLLIVELLNTAIEATVDRIGTERHELSKQAKDYGSAAVLMASVLVAATWALVAWSRFS